MSNKCFKLKSTLSDECSRFDKYFEDFKSSLASMNLNISQSDQIIKTTKHMLNEYNESTKNMLQKNREKYNENSKNFSDYVINKLDSIGTSARR